MFRCSLIASERRFILSRSLSVAAAWFIKHRRWLRVDAEAGRGTVAVAAAAAGRRHGNTESIAAGGATLRQFAVVHQCRVNATGTSVYALAASDRSPERDGALRVAYDRRLRRYRWPDARQLIGHRIELNNF